MAIFELPPGARDVAYFLLGLALRIVVANELRDGRGSGSILAGCLFAREIREKDYAETSC